MTLQGKNILVTGASGLIGSNLIQRLKDIPDVNVKILVHKKVLGSFYAFESIRTDLLDQNSCDTITLDTDIVFHCAANSSGAATHIQNPASMARDNTIMNVNLLDACYRNKVKKFVWLASTTGYPEGDHAMKEEEMFVGDPFSKYFAVGWMKRYTEKLCELYSTKVPNPMSCAVLRPSNIYGPNDKIEPDRSHVLASLIRKTIEGQNPVEVWGDGQDIRDVLYVDDMVDAMIMAAEKVEGFNQFNIGYGEAYSVLDLLDKIQSVAGKTIPYKLIPTGPQMIPVRRVDISKAKSVLGWEPKVKLEEGLQKTYKWMESELKKSI